LEKRIKGHRRVRAGDLVPHEFNYRTHPEIQREALEALYRQVGFARSLLAYELPDARLKLIDGHVRRDIDPDMEVDVEVLDANDEEARTRLLSIDPLAALAEEQEQLPRMNSAASRYGRYTATHRHPEPRGMLWNLCLEGARRGFRKFIGLT